MHPNMQFVRARLKIMDGLPNYNKDASPLMFVNQIWIKVTSALNAENNAKGQDRLVNRI